MKEKIIFFIKAKKYAQKNQWFGRHNNKFRHWKFEIKDRPMKRSVHVFTKEDAMIIRWNGYVRELNDGERAELTEENSRSHNCCKKYEERKGGWFI